MGASTIHRTRPRARASAGACGIALALAACLGARDARGGAAIVGTVADPACTAAVAWPGEAYGLKLVPGLPASRTDFLADLRAKGGASIGRAAYVGGSWIFESRWRIAMAPPEDVGFVYVTGPDGRIAVDSSLMPSAFDFGLATEIIVGNSLPIGVDAGIGLVLPAGGGSYVVDLDGPGPQPAATFPFGTASAVQVVFAPLAEVNPLVQPSTCDVGGAVNDPFTNAGTIVGYNAYRVADGGSRVPPTVAQFAGHWQAYLPFSPSLPDVALTTCRSVAIADPAGMAAVSGYRDNDNRPYSGDELLIFNDGALNGNGTPRASGTPPAAGVEYWYAFQPVIGQSAGQTIANLQGIGLTNLFTPTITVIATPDGPGTGADFDGDGRAELYSPQARLGIGGLGLTNGSYPALSTPVLGALDARGCSGACPPLSCDGIDVLPPVGCEGEAVELTALISGGLGRIGVEWDVDGDTIADATGSPALVLLPAGASAVGLTVTDSCTPVAQSCTASTVVTVNAEPVVTASAGGPTTFCARDGGSVTLTGDPPGLATWQWRLDGADLPGQQARTIVATASGAYTVVATDAAGCGSESAAVTIDADACTCLALDCGLITIDPLLPCADAPISFSVSPLGGDLPLFFSWDVDGDTTVDGTTNPFTTTLAASAYTVGVSVQDSCPGFPGPQECSVSRPFVVAPGASSIGEVSGPSDRPLRVLAHGAALEVSARPAAAAYDLYGNAIGTWVPGPTPALACLVTTWTDLGGGRLRLDVPLARNSWCVVTASNTCGEGPAGTDSFGRDRAVRGNFALCGALP
jgi:hypothetical protein